jgi:hypothetical protein
MMKIDEDEDEEARRKKYIDPYIIYRKLYIPTMLYV